jgi:prepilin peptidase CpaA
MHAMNAHVLSFPGLPMALPGTVQQAIMLLCIAELIVLLVIAALSDAHGRHDLGVIALIIAMLALPYGLAAGWSFPVGIAGHVISAGLLGGAMFAGFRFGVVGNGDVGLMTALGLWLSPPAAISALMITAITAALLTSTMQRQRRCGLSPPRVPYAVGIAAAGIVQFAAPLAHLLC